MAFDYELEHMNLMPLPQIYGKPAHRAIKKRLIKAVLCCLPHPMPRIVKIPGAACWLQEASSLNIALMSWNCGGYLAHPSSSRLSQGSGGLYKSPAVLDIAYVEVWPPEMASSYLSTCDVGKTIPTLFGESQQTQHA